MVHAAYKNCTPRILHSTGPYAKSASTLAAYKATVLVDSSLGNPVQFGVCRERLHALLRGTALFIMRPTNDSALQARSV